LDISLFYKIPYDDYAALERNLQAGGPTLKRFKNHVILIGYNIKKRGFKQVSPVAPGDRR
jgi:hypothetical protein